MKKSQIVIDAESEVEAKKAALQQANEAVEKANSALSAARSELAAAYRADDDKLPKCRMILISWHTGKPCGDGHVVVILRKTPGGLLVVRNYGEPSSTEFKFKLDTHRNCYRQAAKLVGVMSNSRELRDVPKEFLPPDSAESSKSSESVG